MKDPKKKNLDFLKNLNGFEKEKTLKGEYISKVPTPPQVPTFNDAQQIANKLNTLKEALNVEVIRNMPTALDLIKEIKNLKGNDRIDISNIRNGEQLSRLSQRIDMNDMRWHGSSTGIMSVIHDATLTGLGTAPSPLSVVPSGVTSLNTLTGAVILAAGTNITLSPVGNTITINASSGSTPAIGGAITGGTDGSVLFINPAGVLAQDNANFNYDNTLNRLNVNQAAIIGTAGDGYLVFTNQTVQPAAPAAGTLLLHGFITPFTTFTRLELNNEAPTALTIGRDTRFEAVNNTGVTIPRNSLVNIDTGVANDIPSIVLADDGSLTKFPVAGVTQDDILDGQTGYVLVIGIMKNIDGQGFTPGFPLWLHPTTPGAFTQTRPVAPSLAQNVGYVMDGGNPTGAFFIHISPTVNNNESGTTVTNWLGNQMTLQSANALTLGLSGANAGAILFKNGTNANILTLQSGVTTTSYTLTLPVAVGAAGTVLTDAAGNGVLSWTAPAGATTITTANESTDTTTFPLFVTASGTQTLQPKNNVNLTFNSNTGALGAITFEVGNNTDTTLARVSAGVVSIEGVTIATATNTLTLTNKSIVASQITTGTFGTGAYTMDTSLTVPQIFNTPNAITASGNAATVTKANRNNVVTNNSAAGLTITLSTSGATAGDMIKIKSLPSSNVAQTITWVNTEVSSVTPSANLNASTTSPRTDGFEWNPLTSLWRCIASC